MSAISKAFGKRFRRMRRAANILQPDLAKKIGTEIVVIDYFEMGTSTPSLEMLVAIARALGVRLADLVDGLEDVEETT